MSRTPRQQTCKRCGAFPMRWEKQTHNGKECSVLVYWESGQPHLGQHPDADCPKMRKNKDKTMTKKTAPDAEQVRATPDNADPLTQAILDIVKPYLETQTVDFDQVDDRITQRLDTADEIFKARLKNLAAEIRTKRQEKTIKLSIPDMPVVDISDEHATFPRLVSRLALGLNVWLVGPAGSGKTVACAHAAKALKIPFHEQSMCEQTTSFDLIGYERVDGSIVRTPFREAWEHGGLILLDEVDKSNPNVLAVIQSATGKRETGSTYTFPDGPIPRHKDCRIAAAANTFGTGADAVYVGSNVIDAGTLNRFNFICWGYDEVFERKLANNDSWVDRVQGLRARAQAADMRVVISPRDSINGARMLAAGIPQDEVENEVIYRGLTAQDRSQLQ